MQNSRSLKEAFDYKRARGLTLFISITVCLCLFVCLFVCLCLLCLLTISHIIEFDDSRTHCNPVTSRGFMSRDFP